MKVEENHIASTWAIANVVPFLLLLGFYERVRFEWGKGRGLVVRSLHSILFFFYTRDE